MSISIGVPILKVNRNADAFHIDNADMSIGTRIREARKVAKLTQKALAAKVGMAQGSLSELETGESQGTTLLATIASALDVNALWLETGRGPMLPGFEDEASNDPAPLPPGIHQDLITTDERELIAMYRAATPRGKKNMLLAGERADQESAVRAPAHQDKLRR